LQTQFKSTYKPCKQTEKGRNNASAAMLRSPIVAVKFTATAPRDENSASCWYCALGPLAETDIAAAVQIWQRVRFLILVSSR